MKIRKAILTGGGHATRLRPITSTINKHLLPLANKPMIFHAIEKAIEVGVTDIFINTNPGETELQKHIGDGGHWGINITFFEQTGGPQGIAHVVNEAQKFIGNDPFMFYLSDNILLGGLSGLFEKFYQDKCDCMLAFSKVKDPERFGVPVFKEDGVTLKEVQEKPKNPPNDFAVTGIYLYGPGVFFDAFNRIGKSSRGEYEISDIHSLLLNDGKRVGYEEITGWWKDTGKPEDLVTANKLLLKDISSQQILPGVMVDENANIDEMVHIGIGTQVKKGVRIYGPSIIAENCILENCTIGPYTTIGQGTEVQGGAHIENSIVLDNANIDCDIHIGNSIVGKSVKIQKKHSAHPEGKRMIIGDNAVLEI